MNRSAWRATGVAALSVLVLGALAAPASASTDLTDAMQRDLGLTAADAEQRLASETAAAATGQALATQLGDSFAGAWYDAAAGGLVVASTDPAQAPAITAAGAIPQQAQRSQADLNRVKAKLDAAAGQVRDAVTSWHVDVRAGTVLVQGTDAGAAQAFADGAGVGSAVTVATVAERPQALADLVGGDAIYNGGGRCSVGFSATGSGGPVMITAGHCTAGGGTWSGSDQTPIGPVATSSFPGDDYGTVAITGNWTPTGQVRSSSPVTGSAVAAIGASTCRSGSTTGYRCGTVQAYDATVNYGGGDVVYGLTQTNACAEPGDSGGSFVSGDQAQGMTSGGSGNCSTGGTTFFQPVNEVLQGLGLTLVTG